MTKVSTQPYKGARDFYPEDKRFQQWMFDKWRRVVERYGYVEYDAPVLEPTDLYLMKGNEEIIKEQTYTFEDRGGRSVTIRTEMTPTVSRMVAGRRQELAYPARWYSFPNLWRYERMQKGRLREFWQPNVDLFGVSSIYGEFEMVQVIDDLIQAFKAKRSSFAIKINSRKLVNAVLDQCEIAVDKQIEVIRLVDKIHKLPTSVFAGELDAITESKEKSKMIVDFLACKTVDDISENLQNVPSLIDMKVLFGLIKSKGISNAVFDPTIMRGFDYYSDIVFEVFDTNPENSRAMMGGGRYDGLVGQFGVEPIPTIGFAWGDVVFAEFLRANELVPKLWLSNEVTILIKDEQSVVWATKAAQELREIGVNTAVDYSGRNIDKQLKNAVKSGVRYVLFIGIEDSKEERYVIKDLKTGKEEKHSIARSVSIIKDSRK